MTKNQMLKKALANRSLINTELRHAITKIMESGCVDLSNDYNVKAVTYAALRGVCEEWRPMSPVSVAMADVLSRILA